MDFLQQLKDKIKQLNKELEQTDTQVAMVTVKRRHNIHKRSIPPGIDRIVVFNLESEEEAIRLIENAIGKSGKKLFMTQLYIDEPDQIKTYVFFEPVPIDATPKERSVFFNNKTLTIGD